MTTSKVRRPARASGQPPQVAAELPVARVAVDVPHAHLDRLFDYLVTADQDASAQPGVRVRVRFAGRLVGGFLVERVQQVDDAAAGRRLAMLDKVVSTEQVLAPRVLALARSVADHYAGTLADVLRLAVPPRHARVEAEPPAEPVLPPPPPSGEDVAGTWGRYTAGAAFLREVAAGRDPAAVWTALPGPGWPDQVAVAVQVALAAGRGALVVVPDHRDVARVAAAVRARCGDDRLAVLTAEAGLAQRYRSWLAVRRGLVRAVVGTRAAMFAPVADLGLAVVWDDGDDLHAEPRAPYPHVREVLAMRARIEGSALVVAGIARTAEAAQMVAAGGAHPVEPSRASVRELAPAVRTAGEDPELAADPAARTARLPSLAWRTAREALATGPVLVQVPRRGYLPALACVRCHSPARCAVCGGPLGMGSGRSGSACQWCGRVAAGWRCPVCDADRFRAVVVGARRTAEELGRSFPGVPVRTSGRDGVLAEVGAEPALVVATPGAEPVADGGYHAALLLDGWALLGRPDLRAAEETLRRWFTAAALVRPGSSGGRVVVLAETALQPVQALLRWDPAGAADRELADRRRLGFPPAVSMAALRGTGAGVADLLAVTELPAGADVLGPVPHDGGVRALVRVPLATAAALADALKAGQAVRSARKSGDFVTVTVDPVDLG